MLMSSFFWRNRSEANKLHNNVRISLVNTICVLCTVPHLLSEVDIILHITGRAKTTMSQPVNVAMIWYHKHDLSTVYCQCQQAMPTM